MLSERAPPEGQEDPPLHQSAVSLTKSSSFNNYNNNNNTSASDDSNNNSDGGGGGKQLWEVNQPVTDQTKSGDGSIGCFSQRSDIIGGVRWEELTKIGQQMLNETGAEEKDISADRTNCASDVEVVGGGEYPSGTGARPKQKLGVRPESHYIPSDSESSSGRGPLRKKIALQRYANIAQRRQVYKRLYREENNLPSLHIPIKVDPSAYKPEVM